MGAMQIRCNYLCKPKGNVPWISYILPSNGAAVFIAAHANVGGLDPALCALFYFFFVHVLKIRPLSKPHRTREQLLQALQNKITDRII